ncbi:transcriptional regulator [uncultured Veillonella sp.]|uniref:helix-turn-helix transcriptional regulator n=1 Tax=uncultured Veillonella sp. TaxID=159268 RepID=UPI0025E373B1|nr:transcriptional regulator [uncultured Veillonella sp.]MDY3974229.1 helix-turn-helix transcriptional regulator [Veillonella caviae]
MSILKKYELLVPFLGEVLGKNCEIVLHDITNLENSIIAIANSEISGRHIGGPATDFVLKLMQLRSEKKVNYITNYMAKSYKGHKLRCSSFFIHDSEKKPIGVLCINYDLSPYIEARETIDKLFFINAAMKDLELPVKGPVNIPEITDVLKQGISNATNAAEEVEETNDEHISLSDISESFFHTADDLIENIIEKQLLPYNVEANRLSQVERMEVVTQLYDNGLFLLKGGISATASKLGVSEPTIYRYINNIKKMRA